MTSILLEIATFCAGLFAGAAAYITFVEHPGRLECGVDLAARQFGPSYRRAAAMQATLAFAGFATGLAAWISGGTLGSGLGAILLGAVIPFTLVVVAPTNKRLLDPGLDRSSFEAAELLRRWGTLHAMRTTLGVVSFLVLVWL